MSKKKKSSTAKQTPASSKQIVKERARKMPFEGAYINPEWQEMGEAMIIVVRKMGSDKYIVGGYLVDVFCLGLKDSYYHLIDQESFDNFKQGFRASHIAVDPTLAQNILYGAIEYAEDLGFQPHSAFATTQYILDDVEELEYMEIEFGKDGKPFYIQGHDDRNSLHIIKMLEKKVGAGNFDYLLAIDNPDFQEDDDDSQSNFQDLTDFYQEEFEEDIVQLDEDKKMEFHFDLNIIATMELLDRKLNEEDESIGKEHIDLISREMANNFGDFIEKEEGGSREKALKDSMGMQELIHSRASSFYEIIELLKTETEVDRPWFELVNIILDNYLEDIEGNQTEEDEQADTSSEYTEFEEVEKTDKE